MFIWNILCLLFTDISEFGTLHTILFAIVFLFTAILQLFLLLKVKRRVRFLPIIITTSLMILAEIAIWITLCFIEPLFVLIFIIFICYFVVATLGTLFGVVLYPIIRVFLKDKVRK